MVQQGRVAEVLALEKKTPMLILTGPGTREITQLREIAAAIGRLEIGEQWLRGKGGQMPYDGPHPGGLLR